MELLSIWIIRLCGLRFTEWGKRDIDTGKGEVDLMAASDNFVYSRWQVQCKNTERVNVDVVAKEIGMAFMTKSDIVLIVTTGRFIRDAIQYVDRLSAISRYYLILIDGKDLQKIKDDRTSITGILNKIARRTKEYLYLLNYNMWEFGSEFWENQSLSPEWSDSMRTPAGIQANNPLGYDLHNTYVKPVLSKPDVATLRLIFQDNDGGVSGYVPD